MTGQIIHKPKGVSLSKEIFEKARKFNSRHVSVAYTENRNGKLVWCNHNYNNNQTIENLEYYLDSKHESIFFFNGSQVVKEDELPFFDIREDNRWVWYAQEGTASILISGAEGHSLYKNFTNVLSVNGANALLDKVAPQFGRLIIINSGKVRRTGNWKETDGCFFSNDDHTRQPYTYHQYHSGSSNYNSNNHTSNNLSIQYPVTKVSTGNIVIGIPGEGMLKYYGLFLTNKNAFYIDDVYNQQLAAQIKPLDFIETVEVGNIIKHAPSLDEVIKLFDDKVHFTLNLIRFDEAKNRTNLKVEVNPPANLSLTNNQRKYICSQLHIKAIMSSQGISYEEAIKQVNSCKANDYSNVSDNHLIQAADTANIKDWNKIQ